MTQFVAGTAVRIEWPNGTHLTGMIVDVDGQQAIGFGANYEWRMMLTLNGEPTPGVSDGEITALAPNEPSGFGAVAVNGLGERLVHVGGGMWINETAGGAVRWDKAGAVAVIDWGHGVDEATE
jgi:hypothetical protein